VVAAPFPEPDAEVSAAAGWMKARTEQDPGARLALVVPDLERVRDRVEALLAGVLSPGPAWDVPPAERRPWNLSIGRPLSEWGLVHAALEALRGLSGPMPFGRASRLLRSPWIGGTAGEAGSRARVEAGLRKAGWFELSAGQLAGAAGRGGCPIFAAGFETALARLSRGSRSRGFAAWAGEFGQILRDLRWPGAEALDSETYQLFQAWTETLEVFAALDAVSGSVDFSRAVGELASLAGERVFQPESADAPIQVLGLLEAAGQSFDAVWISGLHDLVWPPPLKPNAFLPARLQRDLGMPRACPERELELARERLNGILQAAPEAVLSWPETAGTEVLRPSPLIAGWIAKASQPAFTQPETWGMRLAAAGSREPLPVDQLRPVTGRRSGGMAVLSDQSRCPFRAAAIHRLAAGPLETPLPGMDPRVRGSWAHAALRGLWADWAGRAAVADLDAAGRRRQIEAAVRAARAEAGVDAGPMDPDHVEIEASRLAALIGQLVEKDLERPDFRVVATEEAVELTLGDLVLSGQVDRLDRDALGEWIIDYKTGEARTRGWLSPRLPDPQVPAYALGRESLAGVAFGILQAGKTGYQGIVCGDQPVGPFRPVEGMRDAPAPGMDWADLRAWWQEEVEALAREFASGRSEVAPRDVTACRYCGLDMLCRRHDLEILAGGSGDGDD
jgi:probable DNA repair protein